MAWIPEPEDRYRNIFLFPNAKPSKNRVGVNWGAFMYCWSFTFSRYSLQVMMPWACIQISSGSREFPYGYGRWYGIRVYWSHVKNWQCDEGGVIFTKGDSSLSRRSTSMQVFSEASR